MVTRTDGSDCAWMVQLVEHWAVMRKVVSSTSAGSSLRVSKLLRRKCGLCNGIRIRLSLLRKTTKNHLTNTFHVYKFNVGHKRTHTPFKMSRAWSSWCSGRPCHFLANCGLPGVMFPKRLVVYGAMHAKKKQPQVKRILSSARLCKIMARDSPLSDRTGMFH